MDGVSERWGIVVYASMYCDGCVTWDIILHFKDSMKSISLPWYKINSEFGQ